MAVFYFEQKAILMAGVSEWIQKYIYCKRWEAFLLLLEWLFLAWLLIQMLVAG